MRYQLTRKYLATLLTRYQAPQVNRTYGYDAAGLLSCLDPTGASSPCSTTVSGVESFLSDSQQRLTQAGEGGTTSSYAYDWLGDLQTKDETATLSLAYPVLGHAHAPSSVTTNGVAVAYSYDADGNLISRGSSSYVYDWQNHLVSVNQNGQVTQFRYDGDGDPVQKVDPNGQTTDDVGEIYEKNLATGQETKRYDLGDTLVATRVGASSPSSTYQDYLHSTVSASNGSSVEYTPYGLVKASSGTLPTDRQFQGQQDQAGVGLYQMGDRWYDPAIGLWTQPDSLVPNVLDPLSLNYFAFVEGNPLRFMDPTGHTVDDPDCHVTNTCTNPGDTPPSGSSSGGQQPPDAQPVCAIFSCTPIGNYAVLVTACDPAGCISWVVPIPGAIPPPDSNNGEDPPDDSVKLDPGAEMLKASTDDPEDPKYNPSSKHGQRAWRTKRGPASRAPRDPEGLLKESVPVGGNSNKRVAVDRDTGEYVVFQQESDGRYHGYATDDWFSLRQSERNAFIDSGLVSPTGRIK